jgi:transketolase
MIETKKKVEQRAVLGDALVKLGSEFPELIVLSPDVSLSTKAIKFKAAYPERFICSGIAEQNTIGMASGLSTMGWIPVVAGYAMFVGGKAWEPLRNSVAYPNLNVKIVATHAGVNVGPDGVTHQAIEDIALMRSIPNMTVLTPTDAYQVESALRAALAIDGPVYIRLERAAVPLLTTPGESFPKGGSLTLRSGRDATVIAIGGMVSAALDAAEILAEEGIQIRVVSMVSIKPLDEGVVVDAARETGGLVVAEDHNRYGGLGGAVAETLARCYPTPMEQVAVQDVFAESGSANDLHSKYGLTALDIELALRRVIQRRGKGFVIDDN